MAETFPNDWVGLLKTHTVAQHMAPAVSPTGLIVVGSYVVEHRKKNRVVEQHQADETCELCEKIAGGGRCI